MCKRSEVAAELDDVHKQLFVDRDRAKEEFVDRTQEHQEQLSSRSESHVQQQPSAGSRAQEQLDAMLARNAQQFVDRTQEQQEQLSSRIDSHVQQQPSAGSRAQEQLDDQQAPGAAVAQIHVEAPTDKTWANPADGDASADSGWLARAQNVGLLRPCGGYSVVIRLRPRCGSKECVDDPSLPLPASRACGSSSCASSHSGASCPSSFISFIVFRS